MKKKKQKNFYLFAQQAQGRLSTIAVPEYRHLIREIGAMFVRVSDDGSTEFALWGNGCVICSDSYKGVLYVPRNHKVKQGGWHQGYANTTRWRANFYHLAEE